MNETVSLLLALLAGISFGILFFGGLWFTVRKGFNSKSPSLIFMGRVIFRLAIVVGGFYYVGAGSWQRMLLCLVGFLVARMVITRMTDKDRQAETILKDGSNEN